MALVVLMGMGIFPTWQLVLVPYLVLLMVMSALGIGLWLTTLAVQYRDISHAMGFIIQLMMYANPVIYPASRIPEWHEVAGVSIPLQWLYALNPWWESLKGSAPPSWAPGPCLTAGSPWERPPRHSS